MIFQWTSKAVCLAWKAVSVTHMCFISFQIVSQYLQTFFPRIEAYMPPTATK